MSVPAGKPHLRLLDGVWHVDYGEPYPLVRCSSFGRAIRVAVLTSRVAARRAEVGAFRAELLRKP